MCLNDVGDGGELLNAGFEYVAPGMSTVWKEYVAKYDAKMAQHQHKHAGADIGNTSDQIMLNTILKKNNSLVKWNVFDPYKYVMYLANIINIIAAPHMPRKCPNHS
eukprot:COSAG01_NODE_4537_length_4938_cov_369.479025_6_plen_106_part_00